ncbi:permease [Enterococcus haemoperoxidus ATCC BAA-382]|uniref:Permease n=1 Tax=Enterococcus haemoperoxidus ATCC BAA-382 TaxID=1158608 RepID=R2Q6Y3_9ENTE|nr:FtsX-like permease family protein [Enterococcus haemoperoxidus]EOH92282.1 permease [Enterococcus haemoperoxidus ATCC BAA-382]EOT61967.1 permease [Enterococcus haemoperoxidus ATCC BAA-382]OJG54123.1 permease [Enterococcus haemoperoxidus]
MTVLKKTALLKTSFREIKQSKARFISIMGIIFLGVMVFVGLKATGPDMTQTASNYYQKQKLPDARIVSTLGLTSKDIEELKQVKSVEKAFPRYTKDLAISDRNVAVKFVSYDLKEKQPLIDYRVVKGRMPEKSGEIVLDDLAQMRGHYKLGETLTLSKEDNKDKALKKEQFKIVGFVQSPEYIENTSRGNTTIGKGSLDFFAVVPKEDMDLSSFTEILVSFKGLNDLDSYSAEYKNKRETAMNSVKQAMKKRPEQRVEEIREESKASFEKAQKEITDGETALKDAEAKLQSSEQELASGKQELTRAQEAYTQQIATAENELAANQAAITNGENELVQQRNILEAKKNELAQASAEVMQGQNNLSALQQQRNELAATSESLKQLANGYQSLAATVAILDRVPDELLAESITDAAPQLQEAVQSLGAPVEISAAINQLISQPQRENIASVMATINAALTSLSNQQTQATQGLQNLDQTIGTINQSIAQFTEAKQQLDAAEAQIAQAEAQLATGKEQLAAGQAQLEQSKIDGQAKLNEVQTQLDEAQAAYNQGLEEFQKKKTESLPKLEEAKQQLEKKQKELADLKAADYYYFTRDDNPGYSEYEDNANRISSLSTVFPIFFFLIAALVSLTTMTRMVEEKRMEIGSLKALGYRNGEIAFKFLVYATIASVCGAVLGLFVGYYLFPTIIFDAYGQLYNIPDFVTPWYLNYSLIGILVAVLCTAGAAMVVLRIDLFSTPASLLRPKAPKAGQRIWLERIKPIWNRLSFIQKVTARNLFRYKQRMLMTVLGIAGCMALIITGFGLKDSISDIVEVQFNKIWHYQAIVTFKEEASEKDTQNYQSVLDNVDGLKETMPLYIESLKTTKESNAKQDVSIYVPEKPKEIDHFILFNDRQSGKKYQLTDDGVIINEKLANLFNYKTGDTLVLKNSDNQEYKFKITAIAENYTGHFAYMSPAYYEKIIKKKPNYNTEFLLFDKVPTEKSEASIGKELMGNPNVLNVSFLSISSDALDDTIHSLNIVVWVLITVSGLLAFIVLYNLTNINISERIRELSTIKVLGFYDKEVTMYVYRENIILTLIGIFFGCFFGKLVHGYVLTTVEVDMLMFSPTIHWFSYLYSGLITLFFTLLVMVFMHRKLKKVDMIEALKSNE